MKLIYFSKNWQYLETSILGSREKQAQARIKFEMHFRIVNMLLYWQDTKNLK